VNADKAGRARGGRREKEEEEGRRRKGGEEEESWSEKGIGERLQDTRGKMRQKETANNKNHCQILDVADAFRSFLSGDGCGTDFATCAAMEADIQKVRL
jgi:hypothetical protein